MSSILEKVEYVLRNTPSTRDDFYALSVIIWHNEMAEHGLAQILFFMAYSEGKLTSEESIQRFRRLLQKKYPELQGKNYNKMKEKETEVRNLAVIGDLSSIWR